ncbi:MAG: sensor histidine kinase KdpD [Thermacetogeniaceae bacterium]
MNEKRADPDAILASIKEDGRGTLTVFLGAAAGVGKTFAMLETARERLDEGLDVLVGWVETHGRADTEALLKGLTVIPPRHLEYQNRAFDEMDLDTLLARRPKIVLVDELAHTNIPGSRHTKRYQDVEELLAAGIDVYTTLNIQHLESLNDVVAQITGISVRETVPDKMLEKAEIQLVDVPPEELIQRFKDGKVYVADKAAEALRKFFRPGNINALRELALRHTARRIDHQLETYMRAHAIEGPWSAGEKVMVCISPSPFAARLIRLARRMTANMQAEWFAVYVDTPRQVPANETEHARLTKNIQLAEELGAETVTITGDDVAQEILEFAKKHNITQIIIGKPLKSLFWEWLHGSVVDKVIKRSDGISVHVISGKAQHNATAQPPLNSEPVRTFPYTAILLMIALITAFAFYLGAYLGLVNIAMLYLLPVLLSAVVWGSYYAVAAAILGIICFDFFFVPPTYSFTVADIRYLLSFAIFLVVALLTGQLSGRLRQYIKQARQRETRTSALYALSRDIAATNELERVLDYVIKKVSESAEGQAVILLPNKENKLIVQAKSDGQQEILVDENERAVAIWAFEHGLVAGRGTDTLAGADCTYIPIHTEQGVLGILGIRTKDSKPLSPEQRRLVEAFANLTAIGISRIQLVEQAKKAHLLAESERLHAALFNSISHELRTPLTSIIGAVTGLVDEDEIYSPAARQDLLQTIKQGALRMNRLVNNLLDMARVESGYLQLNKEWCDLQDLIGVAAGRVDALRSRSMKIVAAPDLPLVLIDFVLIEQVLVNLLDNAAKYSKPGTTITITADRGDKELAVAVADQGPGIPEDDRELVFDKFYRLRTSRQIGGTGLGLTICKAIVDAHGGRIWVDGNPGGGALITFTLPLDKVAPGDVPEPEMMEKTDNGHGD